MTTLIVSSQPSVADISIDELAIKYPQCQDSDYRQECFEDFLSNNGHDRNAGYFKENLMWEGLIWEDGKLLFEYSEGVRTSVYSCRKARTWYHCPNGDKQKPLDGGNLVFNKNSKAHEREGKWAMHYVHGDVFEGNYKNGLIDGFGKYTWVSGSVYEGNYKNDAQNGFGKYTWVSGNVYEGNYKNNAQNGYGKMTWSNGDIYEGNYKNGLKDGFGKYTWVAGHIYEGNWKDDKRD